MIKIALVWFLILILGPTVAVAEWSGYLKMAPSQIEPMNGSDLSNQWMNEAYLGFTKEFRSFYVEAAEQLQILTAEQPTTRTFRYRLDQDPAQFYDSTRDNGIHQYNVQGFANLNRLHVDYRAKSFEVDMGRQVVSLGVSKISSPFQIINPFNIGNYDLEQFDGVDAVVLKDQLTQSWFIRAAQVGGNESLSFLEVKKQFRSWSTFLYLARYQKSDMGGFSIVTNIRNAGFYVEASSARDNDVQLTTYQTGTLGFDYQFKNTFYTNFEFFYNGSGSPDYTPNPEVWFRPFKNKYYALAHLTYEITPLLKSEISNYFNIYDTSSYSVLKFDYNIIENTDLVAAAGINSGTADARAEFSSVPNFVYMALKYFF